MSEENKDKEKFNLITQPWIPCRMLNEQLSRLELFGIEEALLRAHEIREIVGDNPLVTITLHRLLLAVLYRSLGPLSYNGEWQEVWQQGEGTLDAQKIKEYFNKKEPVDMHSRFYLFDERHPFYQSTETPEPVEGKHFSAKLFFHDNDSAILFEHSRQSQPPELSPAQAARLLVAFQSFDVMGLKTPKAGEPRSAKASPLLKAAVGLAKGKNLFQTLMLNLYWDDKDFFTRSQSIRNEKETDLPVWERNELIKARERRPVGYLDLLTWQSRRIRLFLDQQQAVVKQVVIMVGEQFPKDYERYDKETMIAFRRDAKHGYVPVQFTTGKALWRDSHALFQIVRREQRSHSLLLLDWLANLYDVGAIEDERVIPMDFFGMNTTRAKPLFWRHERLPLPVRYLSNNELCRELKRVLIFAEDTARLLIGSVRRFTVIILLPENIEKNPDYFTPLFSHEQKQVAEKTQWEYEAKNGYKRVKQRPNPIDARTTTFGPEMHYWPRLEYEFRRVLVALALEQDNWPQQRERWARAVDHAAKLAMQEIIGGTADSTRTLRAAAIAQEWFDAEFNTRRKRYLGGEAEPDTEDDTADSEEHDEPEE